METYWPRYIGFLKIIQDFFKNNNNNHNNKTYFFFGPTVGQETFDLMVAFG